MGCPHARRRSERRRALEARRRRRSHRAGTAFRRGAARSLSARRAYRVPRHQRRASLEPDGNHWKAADGTWGFSLADPDANLVLGYLSANQATQLAQLAASDGWRWEQLFSDDLARPIAGTIGAYALLHVGDLGSGDKGRSWDWSGHLAWGEMLARSSDAPSDGLAIFGELLARQGRHSDALRELSGMRERGLPIFSIGLRLAIERLRGYQGLVAKGSLPFDGDELQQLIMRLGGVAAFADFSQPVLAFTTAADGKPGRAPRARLSSEQAIAGAISG